MLSYWTGHDHAGRAQQRGRAALTLSNATVAETILADSHDGRKGARTMSTITTKEE
jgi:hypothetical protein